MIYIIVSILTSLIVCGILFRIHEDREDKRQQEFLTEIKNVTVEIITDYLEGK